MRVVRALIISAVVLSTQVACGGPNGQGGFSLYSGAHQGLFAPPTVGGAAAIPLWTYPDPAARTRVNPWQSLGAPGLGQVNIQSACSYGGCKLWR